MTKKKDELLEISEILDRTIEDLERLNQGVYRIVIRAQKTLNHVHAMLTELGGDEATSDVESNPKKPAVLHLVKRSE